MRLVGLCDGEIDGVFWMRGQQRSMYRFGECELTWRAQSIGCFSPLFGWLRRREEEDETFFFSCDFDYRDPKIGGFIRQLRSSMVGHGGAGWVMQLSLEAAPIRRE